MLLFGCWLMNHMTYLQLRQKYFFCTKGPAKDAWIGCYLICTNNYMWWCRHSKPGMTLSEQRLAQSGSPISLLLERAMGLVNLTRFGLPVLGA